MDFGKLRESVGRANRSLHGSGNSGSSAGQANQVIQNWTNAQTANQQAAQQAQQSTESIGEALKRLNVQNDRQNQTLSSTTEANDVQKFMKGAKDLGDQVANITGFNEALDKAKKEANVSNVLDAAGKFVAGLPGQVAGGLIGAPAKFYEAATGDNIQEMQHDNATGKDYISTQKLDLEQRMAVGGDALVDVVGLPFGGTGKLAKGVIGAFTDAAGKDVLKGVGSVAKDVVGGAAEEAGEEIFQTYLESVRGTESEHGLKNISNVTPEEVIESGLLGAAGGGIMGGAGHAINAIRNNRADTDKASSAASVGNPAPTTPRNDYHEQGVIDSTGHQTQTAQKWMQDQAKQGGTLDEIQGVQSAKNLTYVDDELGQNEFKMGFDDFRNGIQNRIGHTEYYGDNKTSSRDVFTDALGGRDEVEASLALWNADPANKTKQIKNFDDLFSDYNPQSNDPGHNQTETDLKMHQVAKQAHDDIRADFLDAYINGHAGFGIANHDMKFVVGKNPANEQQLRTMFLAGINRGTGYHFNSANHKAFNSDTDGDLLFVAPNAAYRWKDLSKRDDGAWPWQRFADETIKPIKVLHNGKTTIYNAHLKDRNGMTERMNVARAVLDENGKLDKWGNEGAAVDAFLVDLSQQVANDNIDMEGWTRISNAVRSLARFLTYDTDEDAGFVHDTEAHGEICTTASMLQNVIMEEYARCNGKDLSDGSKVDRAFAKVADTYAGIIDRGSDPAHVEQVVAEKNLNTAIEAGQQDIKDKLYEVQTSKIQGNKMEESKFGGTRGELSPKMQEAFGYLCRLLSINIAYDDPHSPQLFRDNQTLLYKVKGCLLEEGIAEAHFMDVVEEYLATLMHINQLTESNVDAVKSLMSDFVWTEMEAKYPNGIESTKGGLNDFLLDFAKAYDRGARMVEEAYQKAHKEPSTINTKKEGKGKDPSKIVPHKIFKNKIDDDVTKYEFKGEERAELYKAFLTTYGRKPMGDVFNDLAAFEQCTFASMTNMSMYSADFNYDNSVTGNPTVDGLLGEFRRVETNKKVKEGNAVKRSIANKGEGILPVLKNLAKDVQHNEKTKKHEDTGYLSPENLPAFINVLDYISQLIGADNAISMGISDAYIIFDKKNKEKMVLVRDLLFSKSEEEFLSNLLAVKLHADFKEFRAVHQAIINKDYTDEKEARNMVDYMLLEADKLSNYSPLHRLVLNHVFRFDEGSNLPRIEMGFLDELCETDPTKTSWTEKINAIQLINSDPGHSAWSPGVVDGRENFEALVISWMLDDKTSGSTLSKKSSRLADAYMFGEQAIQLDNQRLLKDWKQGKASFKNVTFQKFLEHICRKKRREVSLDIMSAQLIESINPSNLPAEKGTDAVYSSAMADMMSLETNGAIDNSFSFLTNGVIGNITEEQFNDDGFYLLSAIADDNVSFRVDMKSGGISEEVNRRTIFRDAGLTPPTKGEPITIAQFEKIIERYPQVLTALCEQEPQLSPLGDSRTVWARRKGLLDTINDSVNEIGDATDYNRKEKKKSIFFSLCANAETRRLIYSFISLDEPDVRTQRGVKRQLLQIQDNLYDLYAELAEAKVASVAGNKTAYRNKVNEVCEHLGIESVRALDQVVKMKDVFDKSNSDKEENGLLQTVINHGLQANILTTNMLEDIQGQLNTLVSLVEDLNSNGETLDEAFQQATVYWVSNTEKIVINSQENLDRAIDASLDKILDKMIGEIAASKLDATMNGEQAALMNFAEAAGYSYYLQAERNVFIDQTMQAVQILRQLVDARLENLISDPNGTMGTSSTLKAEHVWKPFVEETREKINKHFDSIKIDQYEPRYRIYAPIEGSCAGYELSVEMQEVFSKASKDIPGDIQSLSRVLRNTWIDQLKNDEVSPDQFSQVVCETIEAIAKRWHTEDHAPKVSDVKDLAETLVDSSKTSQERHAAQDKLEAMFRNWNLVNGREQYKYATIVDRSDMTKNGNYAETVSNAIENVGEFRKLLLEAENGDGPLADFLEDDNTDAQMKSQNKFGNWRHLSIHLDSASVFAESRAAFQSGTGSIPSGVAADNMLNRSMAPLYMINGDITCGEKGQRINMTDALRREDGIVNGRYWYSMDDNPKNAKLLNWNRYKELQKSGVSEFYIWDSETHAQTCTCPCCKLQAPAPKGSHTPNYGPMKDVIRRYINSCEPAWLKLKKSIDKAQPLDRTVATDAVLKANRSFTVQNSANYKGSNKAASLHTFLVHEGLLPGTQPQGFRNRYCEVLTKTFTEDSFYKLQEFGITEARLLTNFLTNYVDIKIDNRNVKTVTLTQLKKWDSQIQGAAQGATPITLAQILQQEGIIDRDVSKSRIELSFTPVSMHSMMQIAADHALEQAAKKGVFEKDGGEVTQAELSQWCEEAWNLENGAEFKTVPLSDLMANYGTRTKYIGTKRNVGWSPTATREMKAAVQRGRNYRNLEDTEDWKKVDFFDQATEKGQNEIKASARAYERLVKDSFDGAEAGVGTSLGYVFGEGSVYSSVNPNQGFDLGTNQVDPGSNDNLIAPKVFGENNVVNICNDKSYVDKSIKWLWNMQNRKGGDRRSLLVPSDWYLDWCSQHTEDEVNQVINTGSATIRGRQFVRLMPQNSFEGWAHSNNGGLPIRQIDPQNVYMALIVNNTDVPDGGIMFFRDRAGEIILRESGTAKVAIDEWENGTQAHYSTKLMKVSDLRESQTFFNAAKNGDASTLERLGFDFSTAQKNNKMSKESQLEAISSFVRAMDKKKNRDTDFLDGIQGKGQCVGILKTKDINEVTHYQPIFLSGSVPEMMNVSKVGFSDDYKRIEVDWDYTRDLKSALEGGIPQKMYSQPAFKAEATLAPVSFEDVYQLYGEDKIDALISMESWGSRAKGKQWEIFANNMYHDWVKYSHGSIFWRMDNGKVKWNKEGLSSKMFENGKPSNLLMALISGGMDAWRDVAHEKVKVLSENLNGDFRALQDARNANKAIAALANEMIHNKSVPNPMRVLSSHKISIIDGEPNLGDMYMCDWGEHTAWMFGFNEQIEVQMAFWHTMNPKMCAANFEQEAEEVLAAKEKGEVPSFKYRSDNKVLVQIKGQDHPVWCDFTFNVWRQGQENNELTGTGIEGNIGSQQQLKYAADGYYLPKNLVRYNMLLSNALGQGNPKYVLGYLDNKSRSETIVRAKKHQNKRKEIRIIKQRYKNMDQQMPTWAFAKGEHAEALNAIGESFTGNPAILVNKTAEDRIGYDDPDIVKVVKKLSLALTGDERAIGTNDAINWLYKFYIGYTSSAHADLVFYKPNVLTGLETMLANLQDGTFLPIKGGITETFTNKSLGERIGMPILPPHLAKRCWEKNAALRSKYHNNIEGWKKAQLEEFMKSRDEIVATTDTAKRTNLSKFAEWIGLKTGLDTNLWATGNIYVTQDFKEFNQQLLESLGYVIPFDVQRAKELNAKVEKRLADSRAVRRSHHQVQNVDADGNHTVAMEDGVAQESAYKFIRGLSALNKLQRLLSPLIPAGAITERGIYTNMTKAALFASDKLGIGPYKHVDEYDFDGRFDLVKTCSQDKNSLALFALIRENEVNGDFSWNYEEFSDINQFMSNLRNIEKNKMKLEKWQRKLTDIMAGKGLFAKGQIENFWNFFCTYGMQHAARGEAEWVQLFAPTEVGGKSIFQSELEGGNAARLMGRVLSPESPYRDVAIVALNHAKRCDMAQRSALGMIWSELVADRPLSEFLVTSNFCPFINYTINTTERVLNFIAPVSSVRYVFINLLSKYNGKFPGRDITWDQLHLEDAQLTDSLREAIALDCAKMGSAAMAAILISMSGAVEPPEDEDKWQNTDEWTIFGMRIRENWWLSDLLGPSLAMVCFARSWELGKPRLDIMTTKLSECLYSNPALKVGGIVYDILNPWDAAADAAETDSDIYGKTKQGDVTWSEMAGTDATMYAMNYMCQFITPSILKEIYRDSQTYNVSYKKVYKTDEMGQIIYNEDGTAQTEYTNYFDAKVRKLAKQNPVWALLCDIVTGNGGSSSGTGYLASEMPNVVIYDPEQIASYKTFSLYNDDGTEKSDSEKEAVALAVISLLQGNDLDELKSSGFAVPYDTLKYTGDVVKSIINKNSDIYKQFVDEGGMDYYKQGDGDYNLGKEQVEKIKAAYDNDTQYWKSFYYDVLWSDQMKQSITKYNQYNTLYNQDRQGNYYATGYARGLLPVLIAQGTTTNPGETTGWANDWGTASVVTGNTMYDTNGNALRALEPYEAQVETPELETEGYTSGWKNYSYGGYGRSYGGRSYGGGGGGGRSYARSGSVYSNAKSSYPNNLSYRGYNAGDLTNLTTSRANVYGSNLDYLRPGFTIKGSRQGYKRNDY